MFARLMPTRNQETSSVKIVSDFDSLISEDVGFKFGGKIYVLKAVNVENFMKLTIAYQNLLEMVSGRAEGQTVTDEEVYQKYFNVIHPIVPDLSFDDLKSMTLIILNNLLNLVFRQLAGDPTLYEKSDQKKNSLIP